MSGKTVKFKRKPKKDDDDDDEPIKFKAKPKRKPKKVDDDDKPIKLKPKKKADNLKKAVGISRTEANKMDFLDLMKQLPSDIKKNIGGQVKANPSLVKRADAIFEQYHKGVVLGQTHRKKAWKDGMSWDKAGNVKDANKRIEHRFRDDIEKSANRIDVKTGKKVGLAAVKKHITMVVQKTLKRYKDFRFEKPGNHDELFAIYRMLDYKYLSPQQKNYRKP